MATEDFLAAANTPISFIWTGLLSGGRQAVPSRKPVAPYFSKRKILGSVRVLKNAKSLAFLSSAKKKRGLEASLLFAQHRSVLEPISRGNEATL
jgi:hypothetical protein